MPTKEIIFRSKIKKLKAKETQTFKEENKAETFLGERTPDILVYESSKDNVNPPGFVVKAITLNNAAIRIGLKVDRQEVSINSPNRIMGEVLGRSTVIESYSLNTNPKKLYDRGIQGKDLKNFSQFFNSNTPRVSINSEKNSFDNILDVNVYGQGSFYKIYDENYKLIPFRDFSKIVPKDLIGRKHVTAYPFVNDLKINFEQFIDPSVSSFDGAIEVLKSRQSLIDNDIRSFDVNSFKGQLMGAGIDYSQKGSCLIENKREIIEGTKDYFLDSAETFFEGFTTPQVGIVGSSGKSFAIQGYSTSDFNILAPFIEINPRDEIYDILTYDQKELLLTGSDRSRSETGYRFKSENCGFIFGESNELGTDSIAFGGLKK